MKSLKLMDGCMNKKKRKFAISKVVDVTGFIIIQIKIFELVSFWGLNFQFFSNRMLLPWRRHSVTFGLIEYKFIGRNRFPVHRTNTIRIAGVTQAVWTLVKHNPIPSIESFAISFLNS